MYNNFKKSSSLLILIFFMACMKEVYGQNFYAYQTPLQNSLIIGVGPSFIYADNGGIYSQFKFQINPAITAAYNRKISRHFNLRANLGYQKIEGQESSNQNILEIWENRSAANNFSGHVSYFDFMPVFNIFPSDHPYLRTKVNIYGGLGLGILMSNVDLEYRNKRDENHQIISLYVPIRAGLSYMINQKTDIMLEGSILYNFSDNVDGNENFNRFNDHLFQLQFMIKRYLNTSTNRN
ncbi:DUF6089 family protein [Belliella aquatica]|uniref:DUF6089 domain-containing protein n=1 Tax=Belliella aquatica TaxID=1323734 RepID=A0ABQ1MXB8_9BACT|nr:DUF6089 family protein [Belliella aquatica]MCH7406743.1 DUF6089 family protein [Belliella aquatica]GGC48824.1 hypothetical protein GCM10010993_29130 [Belliella aquatica]